ncbi:unnamed protein product [Psylliodes chrysocephalus]|uniref:Glutathione S-transferase n=1 Tax=Psylliodes chrysocephalus TaxID=3402493 RepID=A0A9P0GCJ0_9CUCU|nr:unnamed protein product [Psylliodes chrysocephala]
MTPKLYKTDLSPPVRAVLLCAKHIGLDLELIDIDLVAKAEQYQPHFLKINPQHTVPVLDDDGFILVDSHAIMVYLVQKYAKNSAILPQNIQKAAIVNHRLHFDTGTLFARGLNISKLIIREGVKDVPQKYIDGLEEAFGIVEKFLEQNSWIAGDEMTIADFSIATSLTTWSYFLPITEEKYPRISKWLKKLEALPYFQEINPKGINDYINLIKSVLNK